MILYLNGEVGPDMSIALCQALNNAADQEIISIYFCSQGGVLEDSEVIIDIINKNKNRIVLYAFGELASAAFIIFYRVSCEKHIMDYTIGLAHLAMMAVPSNQSGESIPDSFNTFSYQELVRTKDTIIDFYKKVGLNAKEMSTLTKGKDVYFGTERLKQLYERKNKK